MRVSQDKARRLTAMVWRDRALRLVPLVVAVIVVFAGASYMMARQIEKVDQTVEISTFGGTVTSIKRGGPRSAIAHVHLEDGRDVDAFSQLAVVPLPGAHVTVAQSRHASGKLTYDVKALSH